MRLLGLGLMYVGAALQTVGGIQFARQGRPATAVSAWLFAGFTLLVAETVRRQDD